MLLLGLSPGGDELQRVVMTPHVILERLTPHTNYSFYVVAYNDRSASQHSKVVIATTLDDGKFEH